MATPWWAVAIAALTGVLSAASMSQYAVLFAAFVSAVWHSAGPQAAPAPWAAGPGNSTSRSASSSAPVTAAALAEDEVCLGPGGEHAACALQAVQYVALARGRARPVVPRSEPRSAEPWQRPPAERRPSGCRAASWQDADPLLFAARRLAGACATTGGLAPKPAGWESAFDRARRAHIARGHHARLAAWVEQLPDIIPDMARSRGSWAAPISGGFILLFSVAALVSARSGLRTLRSSEIEAEKIAAQQQRNEVFSNTLPDKDGDSSTPAASDSESDASREPDVGVGLWGLYRLATPAERAQLLASCGLSAVHGAFMPLAFNNFHLVFNALFMPNDDGSLPPAMGPHTRRDEATASVAKRYLLMALVVLVARAGAMMLVAITMEKLSVRIRYLCFQKLLAHGPQWHDNNDAGEVSSHICVYFVCMFLYIYIYICTCIYIYIYISLSIYIYTYTTIQSYGERSRAASPWTTSSTGTAPASMR